MTVRQTQISYDENWHERKIALGKKATWQVIMKAGIMSLEAVAKEDLKDVIRNIKDELNIDPVEPNEVQEEVQKEVDEEIPSIRPDNTIRVILNKPRDVKERQFHILRDNRWNLVSIEDILVGEVFRVVDDGSVVKNGEDKHFKLQTTPREIKGQMIAEVLSEA